MAGNGHRSHQHCVVSLSYTSSLSVNSFLAIQSLLFIHTFIHPLLWCSSDRKRPWALHIGVSSAQLQISRPVLKPFFCLFILFCCGIYTAYCRDIVCTALPEFSVGPDLPRQVHPSSAGWLSFIPSETASLRTYAETLEVPRTSLALLVFCEVLVLRIWLFLKRSSTFPSISKFITNPQQNVFTRMGRIQNPRHHQS